jgi:predicted GNAT family acetyltransferase
MELELEGAGMSRGGTPRWIASTTRMEDPDPDPLLVVHNHARSRFQIDLGGQPAVADYIRSGDRVSLNHTVVPYAHRGKGIAATLVREALNWARDEGLTVRPQCSYVGHFITQNPEYRELLGD